MNKNFHEYNIMHQLARFKLLKHHFQYRSALAHKVKYLPTVSSEIWRKYENKIKTVSASYEQMNKQMKE